MHCTLAFILCSLSLVSLTSGSGGNALFIQYLRNNWNSKPSSKQVTIEYNNTETVVVTCSITSEAINGDENPYLSWIDEFGNPLSTPIQGKETKYTKVLEKSDDGTELVCKAESKGLNKKWEIVTNFVRWKSHEDGLKKQTNSFSILLICIGAVVLAAILFLVLIRAIQKCKEKKRDTYAGTDQAPLENQTVVYSEILKSNKSNNPSPQWESPQYAVIGINNLSCVQDDTSYVKFDRPDSCVTDSRAGNKNQAQIPVEDN